MMLMMAVYWVGASPIFWNTGQTAEGTDNSHVQRTDETEASNSSLQKSKTRFVKDRRSAA